MYAGVTWFGFHVLQPGGLLFQVLKRGALPMTIGLT